MAIVRTVSTVFRGVKHDSDLWVAGYGRSQYGYCTSLDQLLAEVHRAFSNSSLELYVINSYGNSERLDTDQELFDAVHHLPHGGVLSVTAVEGHTIYYATEDTSSSDGEQVEDSDTDSDSSDSEYEYEAHGRHKHARIARRFAPLSWDRAAPKHTLRREDHLPIRDDVRHLQYVLTMLGYMSLSDTRQLVGSYQSNTQEAVRRFRTAYGIEGSNMDVYNKKTAQVLAQVARQYRILH